MPASAIPSTWNEEISATAIAVSSRPQWGSAGTPMLPTSTAAENEPLTRWWVANDVVVLPLVPVIPMTVADVDSRKIAISIRTRLPSARARRSTGASAGTAGLRTTMSAQSTSASSCRPSTNSIGRSARLRSEDSSAASPRRSVTRTSAPWSNAQRATPAPPRLRPRPTTSTRLPLNASRPSRR